MSVLLSSADVSLFSFLANRTWLLERGCYPPPPGTKPRHAGNICRGIIFASIQENIFEERICQILGGIHCGADTCRSCIRNCRNTGGNPWRIIDVLVSCQGVYCQCMHATQDRGKTPSEKAQTSALGGAYP